MRSQSIKLLKLKLRTAKAEERQWAKAYNSAERAMLRIGKQIDELIVFAKDHARLQQGQSQVMQMRGFAQGVFATGRLMSAA